MSNIVLSADSTCDLGEELRSLYNVHFYPFHVEFRGKCYADGIEITPEEIYAGYYEDGSMPKTSAINVGEYIEHFTALTEGGAEVIHIGLGGALSSAVEHAVLAARAVPGVHVVDSCNLSSGVGQLVLRAARMIESGMSAVQILASLEVLKPRVHASFVIDTMDFLAAGGRCPQVVSQMGKALHVRPEIVVDNKDGSMHVGKLHHGSTRKALKRYVADTIDKYGADNILLDDIFVTHSGELPDDQIEEVCDELRKLLPVERIHVTRASCTISAHCGPKTLGVLFVTRD